MSTSAWKILTVGAAVVPVLGFAFGGWCVVTVDDLPEYAVAGQPLALSYTVRQHGMSRDILVPGMRYRKDLHGGNHGIRFRRVEQDGLGDCGGGAKNAALLIDAFSPSWRGGE